MAKKYPLSSTQIHPIVRRLGKGVLSVLLLGIFACQAPSQPEQKITQDPNSDSQTESRLTLNNATLEQSNDRSEVIWKIKFERGIYSQDRKLAYLEGITGNIFQDGKLALQVSAQKGEIHKDRQEIFLRDEIIATDLRNKTVITGKEIEWYPKQDLLIVRQNLTGSHPKLEVSADEGRYFFRRQYLELSGNIIAFTNDPPIQLKAEHLFWEIPQQKIKSYRSSEKKESLYPPLQIVRSQDGIVSDRVLADRLEVDLNRSIALLQKNVEFKSLAPPIQIASNSLIWNYKINNLISDTSVQIIHSQQQLTITANRGQVDLHKEIAHFKDGVTGISQRDRARLYSQELIWQIPTEKIEAIGNVIYQQTEPSLNLTGVKAIGKLANNSMIVSGNKSKRVITEITP